MSRHEHAEVLRSTCASTLVPTSREVTWHSIETLVAALWPVQILDAQPPHSLLHSVADRAGGEPQCWLTWTLDSLPRGATRVTLVHSEQFSTGPPPELEEVLLRLLAQCIQVAPTA